MVIFPSRNDGYLMVTLAPTSAILAAILSASSLETASLMALGASSTTAFASFKPRPVSSRTTLMTLILLVPTSVRTASNSVFSSTGAAASTAGPAAGAATAATGAALTPHFSCSVLVSSTSSRTFNFSISVMMSATAIGKFLFLSIVTQRSVRCSIDPHVLAVHNKDHAMEQ